MFCLKSRILPTFFSQFPSPDNFTIFEGDFWEKESFCSLFTSFNRIPSTLDKPDKFHIINRDHQIIKIKVHFLVMELWNSHILMFQNRELLIPPGILIPECRLYLSSIPASCHRKLPNPVSHQTYCGPLLPDINMRNICINLVWFVIKVQLKLLLTS